MPSKLTLLTTCVLLSLPAAARAESSPRTLSFRVQCPQNDVGEGRDSTQNNEMLLLVEPNKRFTFSMGFVLTYDSAPPATVSWFDTQLRSGIGVKF